VVVWLPADGLRLQFDGRQQYLRVIEVLEWGKFKLTYNGTELGRQGSVTFKQIYSRAFGPTHPGTYNSDAGVYILSYPGVAFTFPIAKDNPDLPESSEGFLRYLSTQNGQNSLECSSMAVYQGHSWPEVCDTLFDIAYDLPYREQVELDYVEADPSSNRNCTFHFLNHPDGLTKSLVSLGETTMQEIIVMLGPPSERFLKKDSRLSIHNPNSVVSGTQLFFNYYHLGIDACFDTISQPPRLCKIILHGNLPGSLSHQKYRRCRWKLAASDSETPFSDFYQSDRKPMILNRSLDSPSSSMELVGEPEVLPMEDWGGTSLYGSPGCVFEVLGNLVASLTIY
jgi:hypothetical protein